MGFWLWSSGPVKLVGSGPCWSESLVEFLVSGWACEGFLGLFLPRPCGLRLGVLFSSFGGDCLVLSYSLHLSCLFGAMGGFCCVFGGLRSSKPRGWLFVWFFCVLSIPW